MGDPSDTFPWWPLSHVYPEPTHIVSTIAKDFVGPHISLRRGTKRPSTASQQDDDELKRRFEESPEFSNLDAAGVAAFNENMTCFFSSWVPDTVRIFAPTGAAMKSHGFWASQIRSELDNRLRRDKYFGREATEGELDWLVDSVLKINWLRIQQLLEDRSSTEHARSGMVDRVKSKVAERNPNGGPKKEKLRRALALDHLRADLHVHDDEAAEETKNGLKQDVTLTRHKGQPLEKIERRQTVAK